MNQPPVSEAVAPPRPRTGLATPFAYALPVVPVLALIASVFLPFVNDGGLWFGLPKLFLWTAGWVLALTPLLLVTDRLIYGDTPEPDVDEQERAR